MQQFWPLWGGFGAGKVSGKDEELNGYFAA
jgi:hypothetical protein